MASKTKGKVDKVNRRQLNKELNDIASEALVRAFHLPNSMRNSYELSIIKVRIA